MGQLKRQSLWMIVFCTATQAIFCGKTQSDFSKKVVFFQNFQNPRSSVAKDVISPSLRNGVSSYKNSDEFLVRGRKMCQQRDLNLSSLKYDQERNSKPSDTCSLISRESSSSESSCAATPEAITVRLTEKIADQHTGFQSDKLDCHFHASAFESVPIVTLAKDMGIRSSDVPKTEKKSSSLPSKSRLRRSPPSQNLFRDSFESGMNNSLSKETSSSESSRSQSPENVPLSVLSTLVTAAFKKPRRAAQGLTVTIPLIKVIEEDKPILLSMVISSFEDLHCNPRS